ncbi:DUF397 domain-containing protein [Nocardia sp. CNY236]|uniref:DUF397 domain-containing protein n=1 Tax=Nocardia sp. CNY236 TaxID=1169152 RepID=UPI0004144DFB|nr:DUF397 domain-containing protein [Nocardia sp. CNY236]
MTTRALSGQWFKSSHSGDGEACVEVAWLGVGRVGIRDSKNPTGPALIVTAGEWRMFTMAVLEGKFDRIR